MLRWYIICFLIWFSSNGTAQTMQDELKRYDVVELRIKADSEKLNHILKIGGIAIDHGSTADSIILVVSKKAFQTFNELGLSYEWIPRKESTLRVKDYNYISSLKSRSACMEDMNYYPAYQAYVSMMYDFEARYPGLCQTLDLGTLSSGRKILAVKITSDIEDEELKPGFFYTSTMHGDELVGYPMMLQLIDYLLCNYDTDDRIKSIVDNVNIYINPLANPDGTYRGGDTTVEQSIRFNNSFADLNRSFPDPKVGQYRPIQEETEIFMQFADDYRINMSCNLHSGVELINYPWDTYSERHADDSWMLRVARDYADTVQSFSPEGYFLDEDNGVTNGFDWYEVNGSRQDYHTYFKRGREMTLELSDIKRLDSDSLPSYWHYNRNALLNYLEECQYGLRGKVTDCNSGEPLKAEVYIEFHDRRNSSVFSDSISGQYFRYLAQGNYTISFMAEAYDTLSQIVTILDKSNNVLDVELCPNGSVNTKDNFDDEIQIVVQGNKIRIQAPTRLSGFRFMIYDVSGQKCHEGDIIDMSIMLDTHMSPGLYSLVLLQDAVPYSFNFMYLR